MESEPTEALDVPRAIGPYRVERRLGAGGMGEVYLAFDARLDRRVALKRLRPDRPGEQERLRREARALARLHHPSIVQCFDVLAQKDGEWLVLEYVEGPRLCDLVAESPLSIPRVVEYGRQIAEGLQVAHTNGILHRDLKSENVMIDRATDRAKILDFGLVRRLEGSAMDSESLTASGALVGTVRAMAPEQALGLEVGPGADLFSLGVLLYEMLTGRSPFQGETSTVTLSRILSSPPAALPPEVPGALAELITRLLEKSPEHRPGDAAEVADSLGRLLPALSSASGRADPERRRRGLLLEEAETILEGLPPEAPAGSSRRRAPAWALVACGVVGVLVGVAWLDTGSSSDEELVEPELAAPTLRSAKSAARGESEAAPAAAAGWQALEAYDRPHEIDRAIEIFQARIEAASHTSGGALDNAADDHSGLARAYWRKLAEENADGMWLEQARAVARRAVSLARSEAAETRARSTLGLVLLGAGEIEAARTELVKALAIDPENVEAHRGLAEAHQAAGRFEAAEASARRALELRPEDRELQDLLGVLYFRFGRLDEAEAAFRRSIELAPNLVHGHRNLAGVLIARGELDEAAAVLERALEIRPTSTVHLNLGTVYFFQGLYSRAAEAYEKALDSAYGVHRPIVWANLGDAYRQIPQRRGEAPRAFEQAIRLLEARIAEGEANDDPWQRSRLALYRAKAGLQDEARRTLAGLEAEDPRSLLRLATTREILGDREEALENLAAAFEAGLDPSEVARDPELVALRADRRFHELLKP